MIAFVRGEVAALTLTSAILEVGGVGLELMCTPNTLAELRVGHVVALPTSMVVREDSLTLFGFAEPAERDMFETVQTVSGVGPRLALAMLSVMGPDQLASALASGDSKALTAIPGIGVKSAQRLVLELRDKVGAIRGSGAAPASGTTAPVPGQEPWRAQVAEALVGLGWSAKQAADAVERVAVDAPADADIASYLRLALRELRP
jgi:holliday junction DNA helicase RuvA